MILVVNNQEYNKAKRNGFNGSYAQFAEACNKKNSELLNHNSLVSAQKYFNDLGSTLNESSKVGNSEVKTQSLIDVSQNRKMMAEVTDNTIYGNLSAMMKTQTTFAMGGAGIGFVYSIIRRTNWIPATIGGLLLGALTGWVVANFKKEE